MLHALQGLLPDVVCLPCTSLAKRLLDMFPWYWDFCACGHSSLFWGLLLKPKFGTRTSALLARKACVRAQQACLCLLLSFCLAATATQPFNPLQKNMLPTHVVINYGVHVWGGGRDCGQHEGDTCPFLPRTCEFLTADHPFRVIWQTTPPKQDIGNTLTERHRHIPHACQLDPSMVLHRGLAIDAIEHDRLQWGPLFHDVLHFAPVAYHAFNGVLLDMITCLGHEADAQAEADHADRHVLDRLRAVLA